MFMFEMPVDFNAVKASLVPIIFTGCISSSICITLEVECQKHINPTVASLILCLESVFGALGGWLILHESLSSRELFGCAIIFLAIVLSQIDIKKIKALSQM